MKTLLLSIGILLLSLSSYGQYSNYNPPKHGWLSIELGGSAGVLGGTFLIVDHRMNNDVGTERQTAIIAFSGILTSATTHLVSRYVRENNIEIDLRKYKYNINKFFNKFKF